MVDPIKSVAEIKQEQEAAGRACWEDLFRNVRAEAELVAWEKTIPRYDCGCVQFYQAWKAKHPPAFPLSIEWKWRLKSAVNEKLGKPNLSLWELQHSLETFP